MDFLSNHQQLFDLLLHYKYAIIIPVTLFEGPLVMLISGFLIKLGYLNIVPAYLCLMLGDLLGDILWYAVGYYGGMPFVRKFGKYISVDEKGIEIITKVFQKYHNPILLVSKLTMGFGFALVTLITAGLVKIPFRRYLILNVVGQLFWTGILMALGFSLGKYYVTINSVFGKMILLSSFVLFFFALIGFGKYMKNRTIKNHSA